METRLLDVLRKVQVALAHWRDNEPIMHEGGEIDLEEFKYLVVDPILEEAREKEKCDHLEGWDESQFASVCMVCGHDRGVR